MNGEDFVFDITCVLMVSYLIMFLCIVLSIKYEKFNGIAFVFSMINMALSVLAIVVFIFEMKYAL